MISIFVTSPLERLLDATSIFNLELRNSQLNVEVASRSRSGGEVTNVDIIRRLSQLEKMVYSSKSNDLDNNN